MRWWKSSGDCVLPAWLLKFVLHHSWLASVFHFELVANLQIGGIASRHFISLCHRECRDGKNLNLWIQSAAHVFQSFMIFYDAAVNGGGQPHLVAFWPQPGQLRWYYTWRTRRQRGACSFAARGGGWQNELGWNKSLHELHSCRRPLTDVTNTGFWTCCMIHDACFTQFVVVWVGVAVLRLHRICTTLLQHLMFSLVCILGHQWIINGVTSSSLNLWFVCSYAYSYWPSVSMCSFPCSQTLSKPKGDASNAQTAKRCHTDVFACMSVCVFGRSSCCPWQGKMLLRHFPTLWYIIYAF